ncbi:hypothetical protein HK099_003646 [Clydaea vesicula]|uniref:DUF1279 domain-containing protein n=1 Tax=Clydaea vesicula TaxID=447962 RepID=A0AAD5Y371_9FUNG|nr:hypothetical protein HK099_003646 [Clydaea vesicula]
MAQQHILGFIAYNIVGTTSLIGCLLLVHFGCDTQRLIDDAKCYLNFDVNKQRECLEEKSKKKDSHNTGKFFADFLIAYALHQLLLPLRLGLTTFFTPKVTKYCKVKDIEFWKKWKYFK